jgi:hypothetical protein
VIDRWVEGDLERVLEEKREEDWFKSSNGVLFVNMLPYLYQMLFASSTIMIFMIMS